MSLLLLLLLLLLRLLLLLLLLLSSSQSSLSILFVFQVGNFEGGRYQPLVVVVVIVQVVIVAVQIGLNVKSGGATFHRHRHRHSCRSLQCGLVGRRQWRKCSSFRAVKMIGVRWIVAKFKTVKLNENTS